MARKQTGTFWKRLQDIGPAIVVAAVVLGPGSIVGASSVGCQYGLLLWWVVPLAGILMIGMTASAMMVGVMHRETPVQSVARAFGRPAALVIGIMMLVAITLFQASNNNAMLMAIEGFWGSETASPGWLRWMVLGAVNALVIALVCWGRDDLYRWVERSMMVLVGVMVLAFATSLVFSLLPNQTDEMKSAPTATDRVVESNQLAEREVASESESPAPLPIGWMNVIALIATTFSVAGAFYQAYQVREKGWTPRDLQTGMIDCVVGIGTLTVLTLMVLATAAISLHGRIRAEELNSAADVALALRPLFGASAQYVFAIGILAGALSSFLVNAMIGGVVFADACNLGDRISSKAVRAMTILTLVLGAIVSTSAWAMSMDLTDFIVVAQALTVLALPALAAVILWRLHAIDHRARPWWLVALAWIGLIVLIAVMTRTVVRII